MLWKWPSIITILWLIMGNYDEDTSIILLGYIDFKNYNDLNCTSCQSFLTLFYKMENWVIVLETNSKALWKLLYVFLIFINDFDDSDDFSLSSLKLKS